MHIFRFWVDFALKRVRDLIRFLSVKLTTGSRILEIKCQKGAKMLKNTRRKLVIFIDMFRFSFDFAPKRVGDLIRFLSVKLTTGSRILEILMSKGG